MTIITDLQKVVECPVCGPAPSSLWMDDGKITKYVRCRQCNTVFASPRSPHSVRFDWINHTYGVGEKAFFNAEARKPALEKLAICLQRHVAAGRLLDIGCDLGHLFDFFPQPAWQRYGIELSPSAAAYAAQHYYANVQVGEIQQANFADAFFDLITMIDMLYYVEEPAADLQKIHQLLKPNGVLAIEISGQSYQLWRSRGWLCKLLEGQWTRLHTDSSYLFWPKPQALQKLLEDSGYSIVEWQVLPSPKIDQWVLQRVTAAHAAISSWASKLSPILLDYSPKYLCVARKQER